VKGCYGLSEGNIPAQQPITCVSELTINPLTINQQIQVFYVLEKLVKKKQKFWKEVTKSTFQKILQSIW
jgi:hypothetical protein